MSTDGRLGRQADLVPLERVRNSSITIVGLGAVGRPLALQLAALGIPKLQLIDFDHVALENLCTQGYRAKDLGLPKAEAAAKAIREFDPAIEVESIADRFRRKLHVHPHIFCAVDSIAARSFIWSCVRHQCAFFGDARMLAGTIRVLTATDPESKGGYERTLFPQHDAQRGACTARGTHFGASIAAGLLINEYVCWLRGQPVISDSVFSLPDRAWHVEEGIAAELNEPMGERIQPIERS